MPLIGNWALCDAAWISELASETLHPALSVFVRPDTWLGRLRGCPPCRLIADNSSLMPLRRPNQAPGQPIGWVCEQQDSHTGRPSGR
jgi:hypothetical protein